MGTELDSTQELQQYAHPELLVTTHWLNEHLNDPQVVIVESDEDVLLYETGHIPGAIKIDWHTDLNDPITRDYLTGEQFSELMAKKGITRDSTVVFYGDNFNWWAAYALWVFTLFGHPDVRLLNGGRQKWLLEQRPLTTEPTITQNSQYPIIQRQDLEIRAFRDDVMTHIQNNGRLVDVRSPQEYSGELLHMPDYPQEGSLRGGHIRGAASIPWKRAANEDGTFRSVEELKNIYQQEQNLSENEDIIVYCRIGERSSHTWFVLHYLLGFPNIRNYDGSWTEWGNLVKAPIEKTVS